MFHNHVIGFYHPIVSISSSIYDPGNRELRWGSSSSRDAVSISEKQLKENIYDKLIKDPVAPRPSYEPSHLELGDLLIFGQDKETVVGYMKLTDVNAISL